MDVADRVRAGVRWLAFGKLASQTVSWALTIVTIRLLTPDDYGLMAAASIFVSFLAMFEELGLRARIVQLPELDHDYVRAVYGLSIVVNVGLAVLIVIAAPLAAKVFSDERLTPILITLSAVFVIASVSIIPDAMIRRAMNFRSMAILEIVQKSIGATVTLGLAALGWGYWSLVIGMILTQLIRAAGLFWISPYRVLPAFRFRGMGKTLVFGGHLTGQRLLWWAYINYDRLLLGSIFGPKSLGTYSVAFDLAYAPFEKIGSAISTTSFSGLSRVAADREMFNDYLEKGLKVLAIASFPLFFGMSAIAHDAIPLLLGQTWSAAAPIMSLLCLSMPFRVLNVPIIEALNSLGLPEIGLRATAVFAALVFAAISIGVAWGAFGVAAAWLGASVGGLLFCLYVAIKQRCARFGGIALAILPALAAATGMYVIVHVVRMQFPPNMSPVLAVAIEVLSGFAVYAVLTLAFDRSGLRLLRSMVWQR
jgi:teichuronic acid exporter